MNALGIWHILIALLAILLMLIVKVYVQIYLSFPVQCRNHVSCAQFSSPSEILSELIDLQSNMLLYFQGRCGFLVPYVSFSS